MESEFEIIGGEPDPYRERAVIRDRFAQVEVDLEYAFSYSWYKYHGWTITNGVKTHWFSYPDIVDWE